MTEQKLTHHPGIAAVLSFIFNGLGQLYNGDINKGLVIMTASSICLILIIVGAILAFHWLLTKAFPVAELIWGGVIFTIGIIGACAIGAYSIHDAYRQAAKK